MGEGDEHCGDNYKQLVQHLLQLFTHLDLFLKFLSYWTIQSNTQTRSREKLLIQQPYNLYSLEELRSRQYMNKHQVLYTIMVSSTPEVKVRNSNNEIIILENLRVFMHWVLSSKFVFLGVNYMMDKFFSSGFSVGFAHVEQKQQPSKDH